MHNIRVLCQINQYWLTTNLMLDNLTRFREASQTVEGPFDICRHGDGAEAISL